MFAFVQINQANACCGAAGFADLFDFGADEDAAAGNQHQVVGFANQGCGDQIAVALAGVDGDIALSAFVFTTVIGNRGTFAVAVGGGGQHLQIALRGFGCKSNQADDFAVGRQAHTAQAAAAATGRTHAVFAAWQGVFVVGGFVFEVV